MGATQHRKPNPPSNLEPAPECFDSLDDWLSYCRSVRRERTVQKRTTPLTRDMARRAACADCTLRDQFLATLNGRCNPPEGAITPVMRRAAGIDDLADEPLEAAHG